MRRADEAPEPSIEIDVDVKYVVELTDLLEEPSRWDDAKEGDMSLTWKFRIFDLATGAAVIDNNNGFAYELWQFSNDKTYRNVKTGKVAVAREWTEALLGRGEITDDQMNELIDYGLKEALVGKRGLSDLEWRTSKKGYERLKIIRLRPYKKRPAAAVPLDEPEAVQAALERDEAVALDRRAKPETRDLVGAAAGRPDVPESKAERQARLRRELEESENDAA